MLNGALIIGVGGGKNKSLGGGGEGALIRKETIINKTTLKWGSEGVRI